MPHAILAIISVESKVQPANFPKNNLKLSSQAKQHKQFRIFFFCILKRMSKETMRSNKNDIEIYSTNVEGQFEIAYAIFSIDSKTKV